MATPDPGRDPSGLQLAISPNGMIHLHDTERPYQEGMTLCGNRMRPRADLVHGNRPDWALHRAVDPAGAFSRCANPCAKCEAALESYATAPVAA